MIISAFPAMKTSILQCLRQQYACMEPTTHYE